MASLGADRGVELRVCEFNVENLFVGLEYYDGQDLDRVSESEWRDMALPQLRRMQKPLRKLWGLAEAIAEIDPDVVMLIEVGGRDSLDHFNHYFLSDRFDAFFIPGNSLRGIDLAFLVKKGLPLRAEARSNRETPVEVHGRRGRYVSRFSRDVAELRLSDGAELRLILLLVHLKSKISTQEDVRGKDVRTAEAIALARLYEALRGRHPEVPIVLGGDFNADVGSLELELIGRTDLIDFRDVIGMPMEDRVTLIHFGGDGEAHPSVLDHLLVSPHLRERIVGAKSYVYRYTAFGVPLELPRTRLARSQLPSDHYPLVLTIRI